MRSVQSGPGPGHIRKLTFCAVTPCNQPRLSAPRSDYSSPGGDGIELVVNNHRWASSSSWSPASCVDQFASNFKLHYIQYMHRS